MRVHIPSVVIILVVIVYVKIPDWISKVHRKYLCSQEQFSRCNSWLIQMHFRLADKSTWIFQPFKDHAVSPNPHSSVLLVITILCGCLPVFVKQFLIAIFLTSLSSSLCKGKENLAERFFSLALHWKLKIKIMTVSLASVWTTFPSPWDTGFLKVSTITWLFIKSSSLYLLPWNRRLNVSLFLQ